MGSPVSAIVANLVMEHIEETILVTSCHDVLFWKRYVDDTWVVLPEKHVLAFLQYVNSIERSIQFTLEREVNSSISFLDVSVTRTESFSFVTSVFRKKTHTDKYLSFDSHHPISQKKSVVLS